MNAIALAIVTLAIAHAWRDPDLTGPGFAYLGALFLASLIAVAVEIY